MMLFLNENMRKVFRKFKTFVVGVKNLTSKATSVHPRCEETESITIAFFFVMPNGKNLNLIYAFWVFVAFSPSLFTCHCKDNVNASSSAFFSVDMGTKKRAQKSAV